MQHGPCRIRFFPTLIFYKMALVWTTLNVFRLERIALFLNANCEANETQRKWYVTQVKHCLDRTSGLTLPPSIPNPNPTRAKPRRKLCAVHHYKRRVKYDKQGLQIRFLNKSTAQFSSHATCQNFFTQLHHFAKWVAGDANWTVEIFHDRKPFARCL